MYCELRDLGSSIPARLPPEEPSLRAAVLIRRDVSENYINLQEALGIISAVFHLKHNLNSQQAE